MKLIDKLNLIKMNEKESCGAISPVEVIPTKLVVVSETTITAKHEGNKSRWDDPQIKFSDENPTPVINCGEYRMPLVEQIPTETIIETFYNLMSEYDAGLYKDKLELLIKTYRNEL